MALRAARSRPSPKRRAAERAAIVESAIARALIGRLEKRSPYFERYDWRTHARPNQIMPAGDWYSWILMAGRGFGKNRTGAEGVRELVKHNPGSHGALVARTAADVRDTMLGNPGSGLMEVFPPSERPLWEPSKRRVTFPNGAYATTYSADEPESLRGPQHAWAWGDEVSTWRYPHALDMLRMGLRLPLVWPTPTPRLIVTMTPRTTKAVKELLNPSPEVEALGRTIITRGTTLDNAANLAPLVVAQLYARYAGTRLERQELGGELVEDAGDVIGDNAVAALPVPHASHRDTSHLGHPLAGQPQRLAGGLQFCRGHALSLHCRADLGQAPASPGRLRARRRSGAGLRHATTQPKSSVQES